jgi:hypothetical protein
VRLLIDADSIVYACGFAAEKAEHVVLAAGGTVVFRGSDLKAARAAAGDDLPVYTNRTAEPIENALHSVKLQLNKTIENVTEKYGEPSSVDVFLTGGGNFRERLAKIKPYKGNRDLNHKPIHMGAIRQYLVKQWGATVVHGIEADDMVSILQCEDPDGSIISSIDKDLLQVPGLHYVHEKGFKTISPSEGLQRLYVQILAGDTTDNVGGCYMIGRGKAIPRIKALSDEEEMWTEVVSAYANSIKQYGAEKCGYSDAKTAAVENARLVYMLREWPHAIEEMYVPKPAELWLPPEERT